MKRSIFILVFLLFYVFTVGQRIIPGIVASGTQATSLTYYVSNAGDDGNDGSSGSPWEHHPWMSTWTGSHTLSAGETVLMNKGDTWTIASPSEAYLTVGQNGTSGNHITTGAYGTGADPIFEISTDASWPVVDGMGKDFITFNGIEFLGADSTFQEDYDKVGIKFGDDGGGNVSNDWVVQDCKFTNFRMGGVMGYDNCFNIVIGDTTETTLATDSDNSNYFESLGRQAIFLMGRDPVTEESNFYCQHNYINKIRMDAGGVGASYLAYGITYTSLASSDGMPKNAYMRWNSVNNIPSWEGLDSHGGLNIYIQDNYVYNCYYSLATQNWPTGGSFTDTLDNLYVERNVVEQPTDVTGDLVYFGATQGSSGAQCRNIYWRDNEFYHTTSGAAITSGYGIFIAYCHTGEVSGNKMYNMSTGDNKGIYIDGAVDFLFDGNFIQGPNYGLYIRGSQTVSNSVFSNNIILANENAFAFNPTGAKLIGNMNIYNNVLFTEGATADAWTMSFYDMTIPADTVVNIKNNILGFETSSSSGRYFYEGTNNGTLAFDYNIWWNTEDASPFRWGAAYRDWTYWQGTASQGANSFGADVDPVLVNAGGSYLLDTDYLLDTGSDAIDNALDVSIITDYAGNARGGSPDIGAYEKQ